MTAELRAGRVRLLRLVGQLIETGNYYFRYHVRGLGEDPDDLARRLYAFAAELADASVPAPTPTLTPVARALLRRLLDAVRADPRASLADGLAAARELAAVLELAARLDDGGPPEAA